MIPVNIDCKKKNKQWHLSEDPYSSPDIYNAATEQLNIEFTLRISAGTTEYGMAKSPNLIKALLGLDKEFIGKRFSSSRTYTNEHVMDLDDAQLGLLVRMVYSDLTAQIEEWAKENRKI
jgi:hypothetical protein